ncbi:hypothetical protein PRIPAC_70190 [Pristionchus pacificus]|uniref:Uncharacterized protein n=1 Tax=Pristionchus pacificus TaxID=54126 RepID=A0A454XJE6_PRIPA|nr:hypothetical protein PRIPAC_70190 [Pristionchus pacificus]|eukprot:PDM73754.1 hypothetical protein PRIPAC_41110 [Pristionchus pacificus]
MLQRCWDMLAEILAFVKESMTPNGEYCTITLSPKPSTAWTRGSLIIDSKGAIDSRSLREDFKEAFGL